MSGKLGVLVLLLGCTRSAPSTNPASTPADPAPVSAGSQAAAGSATGAATPGPQQKAAPAPGIGEACGAGDACAPGLTCVAYYGIAGARGPRFTSCEIPCRGASDCSGGRKCITIADGPGQVCR